MLEQELALPVLELVEEVEELDGVVEGMVEDTVGPVDKAVVDMPPDLWLDPLWESSHFGRRKKKG